MPNRFEIWSLARWRRRSAGSRRKCTRIPGLAGRSAPSGSEAWRTVTSPFFYKRRWNGLAPLPARSSSTGRPENRRARAGDRRGESALKESSGLRRRGPLDARIAGRAPPAFPWVRLVHADFADLDALREAAGGRRSTVRCWTSGSLPSRSTIRRAAFRSGGGSPRHAAGSGRRWADARPRSSGTTGKDLADLFYRFGEERFSRRIARTVVESRGEGSRSGRPPGSRNW